MDDFKFDAAMMGRLAGALSFLVGADHAATQGPQDCIGNGCRQRHQGRKNAVSEAEAQRSPRRIDDAERLAGLKPRATRGDQRAGQGVGDVAPLVIRQKLSEQNLAALCGKPQ